MKRSHHGSPTLKGEKIFTLKVIVMLLLNPSEAATSQMAVN